MIQANELRLGNYYDNHNQIMQVTPNTIEEVWIAQRNWCNPIPLTEEWLLKLGADKYNPGRYMLKLSETLIIFWNIGDDYFICELSSRSTHVCYFNEKKHVHQLQNLYFALTEKELTLKS